jgi:hypothetical protein
MTKHVKFSYHLASESDWSRDDGEVERYADDRSLDERSEIVVEFSYPLRAPVQRLLTNEGGFTRLVFAQAVAQEYAKIYQEEDASRTASPAPAGMLLNRSRTDGVHGIWGHDLVDLILEGARLDDEGVWQLGIGS